MNVAELFQLESSLQGDRVVDAPANEYHILSFGVAQRLQLDRLLAGQDLLLQNRYLHQFGFQLSQLFERDGTETLSQVEGQEVKAGNLSNKGLGSGNRDFNTAFSDDQIGGNLS